MFENLKKIAKQGLDNLLSQETPNIVDIMLEKKDQKIIPPEILVEEVKKRVLKSFTKGYSEKVTEKSDEFLKNHIFEKVNVAILYVDLAESTSEILNLTKQMMSIIMRTFVHEMAYLGKRHDGLVLKFVGDAVIVYFVGKNSPFSVCDKAVSCAESMIKVLKLGVNPILIKNGLLELRVKIGIDFGEVTVISYGEFDKEIQLDILGVPINIASKLQSLAHPDQILIGNEVYQRLDNSISEFFVPLEISNQQWGYHLTGTQKIYPVYAYTGK